jgi:hypothetical protein
MYIFVLISPLSYSVLTSLCNTRSIVVEALFITVIGLNLTCLTSSVKKDEKTVTSFFLAF